jgi:predicted Zn-dependent protease
VRVWLGEPEVAVEHFALAMRLSPLDPLTFVAQGGTAFAHIFAGCYDLALSWAQKAVRERPNWPEGQRLIAAAAALSGRSKEAQQAIARMREMDPNWRLSNIRRTALFRRPEITPNTSKPCKKRVCRSDQRHTVVTARCSDVRYWHKADMG